MKPVPSYVVHIWQKNLDTSKSLYAIEMRCGAKFYEHTGRHIAVGPEEATCLRCLRNLQSQLAWRVAQEAADLEKTIERLERVVRDRAKRARTRERNRAEKNK